MSDSASSTLQLSHLNERVIDFALSFHPFDTLLAEAILVPSAVRYVYCSIRFFVHICNFICITLGFTFFHCERGTSHCIIHFIRSPLHALSTIGSGSRIAVVSVSAFFVFLATFYVVRKLAWTLSGDRSRKKGGKAFTIFLRIFRDIISIDLIILFVSQFSCRIYTRSDDCLVSQTTNVIMGILGILGGLCVVFFRIFLGLFAPWRDFRIGVGIGQNIHGRVDVTETIMFTFAVIFYALSFAQSESMWLSPENRAPVEVIDVTFSFILFAISFFGTCHQVITMPEASTIANRIRSSFWSASSVLSLLSIILSFKVYIPVAVLCSMPVVGAIIANICMELYKRRLTDCFKMQVEDISNSFSIDPSYVRSLSYLVWSAATGDSIFFDPHSYPSKPSLAVIPNKRALGSSTFGLNSTRTDANASVSGMFTSQASFHMGASSTRSMSKRSNAFSTASSWKMGFRKVLSAAARFKAVGLNASSVLGGRYFGINIGESAVHLGDIAAIDATSNMNHGYFQKMNNYAVKGGGWPIHAPLSHEGKKRVIENAIACSTLSYGTKQRVLSRINNFTDNKLDMLQKHLKQRHSFMQIPNNFSILNVGNNMDKSSSPIKALNQISGVQSSNFNQTMSINHTNGGSTSPYGQTYTGGSSISNAFGYVKKAELKRMNQNDNNNSLTNSKKESVGRKPQMDVRSKTAFSKRFTNKILSSTGVKDILKSEFQIEDEEEDEDDEDDIFPNDDDENENRSFDNDLGEGLSRSIKLKPSQLTIGETRQRLFSFMDSLGFRRMHNYIITETDLEIILRPTLSRFPFASSHEKMITRVAILQLFTAVFESPPIANGFAYAWFAICCLVIFDDAPAALKMSCFASECQPAIDTLFLISLVHKVANLRIEVSRMTPLGMDAANTISVGPLMVLNSRLPISDRNAAKRQLVALRLQYDQALLKLKKAFRVIGSQLLHSSRIGSLEHELFGLGSADELMNRFQGSTHLLLQSRKLLRGSLRCLREVSEGFDALEKRFPDLLEIDICAKVFKLQMFREEMLLERYGALMKEFRNEQIANLDDPFVADNYLNSHNSAINSTSTTQRSQDIQSTFPSISSPKITPHQQININEMYSTPNEEPVSQNDMNDQIHAEMKDVSKIDGRAVNSPKRASNGIYNNKNEYSPNKVNHSNQSSLRQQHQNAELKKSINSQNSPSKSSSKRYGMKMNRKKKKNRKLDNDHQTEKDTFTDHLGMQSSSSQDSDIFDSSNDSDASSSFDEDQTDDSASEALSDDLISVEGFEGSTWLNNSLKAKRNAISTATTKIRRSFNLIRIMCLSGFFVLVLIALLCALVNITNIESVQDGRDAMLRVADFMENLVQLCSDTRRLTAGLEGVKMDFVQPLAIVLNNEVNIIASATSSTYQESSCLEFFNTLPTLSTCGYLLDSSLGAQNGYYYRASSGIMEQGTDLVDGSSIFTTQLTANLATIRAAGTTTGPTASIVIISSPYTGYFNYPVLKEMGNVQMQMLGYAMGIMDTYGGSTMVGQVILQFIPDTNMIFTAYFIFERFLTTYDNFVTSSENLMSGTSTKTGKRLLAQITDTNKVMVTVYDDNFVGTNRTVSIMEFASMIPNYSMDLWRMINTSFDLYTLMNAPEFHTVMGMCYGGFLDIAVDTINNMLYYYEQDVESATVTTGVCVAMGLLFTICSFAFMTIAVRKKLPQFDRTDGSSVGLGILASLPTLVLRRLCNSMSSIQSDKGVFDPMSLKMATKVDFKVVLPSNRNFFATSMAALPPANQTGNLNSSSKRSVTDNGGAYLGNSNSPSHSAAGGGWKQSDGINTNNMDLNSSSALNTESGTTNSTRINAVAPVRSPQQNLAYRLFWSVADNLLRSHLSSIQVMSGRDFRVDKDLKTDEKSNDAFLNINNSTYNQGNKASYGANEFESNSPSSKNKSGGVMFNPDVKTRQIPTRNESEDEEDDITNFTSLEKHKNELDDKDEKTLTPVKNKFKGSIDNELKNYKKRIRVSHSKMNSDNDGDDGQTGSSPLNAKGGNDTNGQLDLKDGDNIEKLHDASSFHIDQNVTLHNRLVKHLASHSTQKATIRELVHLSDALPDPIEIVQKIHPTYEGLKRLKEVMPTSQWFRGRFVSFVIDTKKSPRSFVEVFMSVRRTLIRSKEFNSGNSDQLKLSHHHMEYFKLPSKGIEKKISEITEEEMNVKANEKNPHERRSSISGPSNLERKVSPALSVSSAKQKESVDNNQSVKQFHEKISRSFKNFLHFVRAFIRRKMSLTFAIIFIASTIYFIVILIIVFNTLNDFKSLYGEVVSLGTAVIRMSSLCMLSPLISTGDTSFTQEVNSFGSYLPDPILKYKPTTYEEDVLRFLTYTDDARSSLIGTLTVSSEKGKLPSAQRSDYRKALVYNAKGCPSGVAAICAGTETRILDYPFSTYANSGLLRLFSLYLGMADTLTSTYAPKIVAEYEKDTEGYDGIDMTGEQWRALNADSSDFWTVCNMLSMDVSPGEHQLLQTYTDEINDRVGSSKTSQFVLFGSGVLMVLILAALLEWAVSTELNDLVDCVTLLRMLPSDLLLSEYVFERTFNLTPEEFKNDLKDLNALDDSDEDEGDVDKDPDAENQGKGTSKTVNNSADSDDARQMRRRANYAKEIDD